MKIIKLNKTHNLYRRGYTHGFRIEYSGLASSREFYRILGRLNEIYSDVGGYPIGTYKNKSGLGPDWIGVKDESVLTLIILSETYEN